MEALSSFRVVQVACGSRDAQTLALTACGKVFSWGDGDFGKLGMYNLCFAICAVSYQEHNRLRELSFD